MTKSSFHIPGGAMFLRYMDGIQRLKTMYNNSSLSFSPLFLPKLSLSNFLNPLFCYPSPPFIAIFPIPLSLQLDCPQLDLGDTCPINPYSAIF